MNRFAALALAGLGGCAVVAVIVLRRYGGETLLAELVASFAGTFIAFMLALSWERDRDRKRGIRESRELDERRRTEARRRFEPVRAELQTNAKSLSELRGINEPPFTILNPQLLEGAWTASATRLSELIADYELIANLATTYGRIEELRWRLRHRTEHQTAVLDGMTAPLIEELRGEVVDLLERVEKQLADPSVQPLGLLHLAKVSGGITLGGTVESSIKRSS